jgi:cell wall assembly regulator SMI1
MERFAARLALPMYGSGVAFSGDGSRLYANDSSQTFVFERGSTEGAVFDRNSNGYCNAIAVRPGPAEARIAIASSGRVSVFDDKGKVLKRTAVTPGADNANALSFSGDGKLLAAATGHLNSKVTTIELFSADGERIRTINDDRGFGMPEICFDEEGAYLITVRNDGAGTDLEIWPVSGGSPERKRVPFGEARSLSQANGVVLVAWREGLALLDDRGKVKWKKALPVDRAALAPDGSTIVAGHRRELTLLGASGDVVRTVRRKSTNEVRSLAVSVDGWLAIGTRSGVEMRRLDQEAEAPEAKPKPTVGKAASASVSVSDAWQRIRTWMSKNAQPIAERLQPGATKKMIADAEAKLGLSFPDGLKEMLALCDGDDEAGLIGGWSLLGIDAIVSRASLMKELQQKGIFDEAEADPHPRVRSAWWSIRWIPIGSSGGGDLICVDLDPGPQGKVGQVILFYHDDGKRLVIADSLAQWLGAIARDLEDDKYDYLGEGGSWSDDAFLDSSLEKP